MKHQIGYKILHGDTAYALEEQVLILLETTCHSIGALTYWETLGAPFYAHTGVAQAMIKVQETKDNE